MKLLKITLLVPLFSLVACGEKPQEVKVQEILAAEDKYDQRREEYANDYQENLKKLLEKKKRQITEYQEQAAKAVNPATKQALEAKIESNKAFIKKLTAQLEK